jgi:IS4 transposase
LHRKASWLESLLFIKYAGTLICYNFAAKNEEKSRKMVKIKDEEEKMSDAFRMTSFGIRYFCTDGVVLYNSSTTVAYST